MEKKRVLIVIILIFVLLLVGASVLYKQLSAETAAPQLAVQETPAPTAAPQPEEATAPQPVPAPDFTVYDIEGNPVKLSDFFGKPIVLNFWASWCGPCKMEMPDFNEKSIALEGEVQFLMVNMTDGGRETVESASGFIAEQGYSFPVFYDSDMDAAYTYGAYSLPTTFFINAEGQGIAQATGAIDMATLEYGISLIYQPE